MITFCSYTLLVTSLIFPRLLHPDQSILKQYLKIKNLTWFCFFSGKLWDRKKVLAALLSVKVFAKHQLLVVSTGKMKLRN